MMLKDSFLIVLFAHIRTHTHKGKHANTQKHKYKTSHEA